MRMPKAAQAPLQLSLLNTLPPNLQRQPLQPLAAPNVQREALSNDSTTISVDRWQAKPKKKAAAKKIKEKRDKDWRHSNGECIAEKSASSSSGNIELSQRTNIGHYESIKRSQAAARSCSQKTCSMRPWSPVKQFREISLRDSVNVSDTPN